MAKDQKPDLNMLARLELQFHISMTCLTSLAKAELLMYSPENLVKL